MNFRFVSAVSFTAAAASAVFACSSSSSGGGTAGACQSYGSALVSYEERCSGSIDPSRQAEVSARYAQLCEGALSLPGVPDISGQLSTCATQLGNASCNQSIDQLDGCDIETKGTLADGAACVAGEECQSGECTFRGDGPVADAGSPVCGTCAPAFADGADCSQGGACVSGDTCKFVTSEDGGFSATCTKKPAPGDIGADCNSNSECKAPNHCSFVSEGSDGVGTCAAAIASGGACAGSNTECADGLVCAGAGTQTCQQPVGEGAACTGNDCAPGLACDFTAAPTCVKIKFAATGAACDGNTVRCSHGNCKQPASDGGTGGGGTGTLTGTCPTIIADGQPCDESSDTASCDDFASCDNGTCVLVPAACK